MGLLLCHDKNFYFIFIMQVLGNNYANAMQKVTTELPPGEGSGF
jgi:hypothetical protein